MFKLMAVVIAKALCKVKTNTRCQTRKVLLEGYVNGLLLPFHTDMLPVLCTYSYRSQFYTRSQL